MADQRDGGIAWTDTTWSPIRGCSRVNASCVNCYAERIAMRFSGPGLAYEGLVRFSKKVSKSGAPVHWPGESGRPLGWNGSVLLVEDHLLDPLRWRRPRRVFVNSMSDLFHENLLDETIDRVLAVMLLAPHHTFQVLTKRPERMRKYLSAPGLYDRVLAAAGPIRQARPEALKIGISNPTTTPPRWIWWGVSVGNQEEADDFIPHLLDTPASVRWVSYEPAHGAVDFRPMPGLNWIVVGGESGPGARPFNVAWARSAIEQCHAAGVACFVKQMGSHVITRNDDNFTIDEDPPDPDFPGWPGWLVAEDRIEESGERYQGAPVRVRLRDRAGGDMSEWRSDLRVREFPS